MAADHGGDTYGRSGRRSHRRDGSVRFEAERLLEASAWYIVHSYGRLMDGTPRGRHVRLRTGEEKLASAKRLTNRETVDVHLIHRRHVGAPEVTPKRLQDCRLILVYSDHDEAA